eukprot:SAG11_NODE_3846_length_2193_cov_1.155205_2_plen_321_part_00
MSLAPAVLVVDRYNNTRDQGDTDNPTAQNDQCALVLTLTGTVDDPAADKMEDPGGLTCAKADGRPWYTVQMTSIAIEKDIVEMDVNLRVWNGTGGCDSTTLARKFEYKAGNAAPNETTAHLSIEKAPKPTVQAGEVINFFIRVQDDACQPPPQQCTTAETQHCRGNAVDGEHCTADCCRPTSVCADWCSQCGACVDWCRGCGKCTHTHKTLKHPIASECDRHADTCNRKADTCNRYEDQCQDDCTNFKRQVPAPCPPYSYTLATGCYTSQQLGTDVQVETYGLSGDAEGPGQSGRAAELDSSPGLAKLPARTARRRPTSR